MKREERCKHCSSLIKRYTNTTYVAYCAKKRYDKRKTKNGFQRILVGDRACDMFTSKYYIDEL